MPIGSFLNATEEDCANYVDYWARLFKASTWEELKMIAEQNKSISEASQTLYELNADEIELQKCYAREEYYRRKRTYERDMALLKAENEELKRKLAEYEKNNK